MNLRERAKLTWEILSSKQKIIAVCLSVFIFCFTLGGWITSIKTYFEVRALQREVKQSKKEAAEALERAAKIAREIKKREAELKVLEGKRDVKKDELKTAEQQASDSLDAVNRARIQPRSDNPSAEQLCRELAELGYPC